MSKGRKGTYDVVIVGGASAGLTASLYCSRQQLKTVVITKDIGGQALLTNEIQNYPGFDEIKGFELMTKFQKQSVSYGTEFEYDEVTRIVKGSGSFSVETGSGAYEAESIILAFGKTPRELGVPGEKELSGRGVSYCAVCDGPLYKGKRIAVIGTGPQLIEAAIYLVDIASELFIMRTSSRSTGDIESIRSLQERKNVKFIDSVKVDGFAETEAEILIRTGRIVDNGELNSLVVDGVFIENGYISKAGFLKGLVDMNRSNEIIIDGLCHTSQEGIFACGDVTNMPYKQVVISAGQGAVAALSAYNYIQKKRGLVPVRTDWKEIKKE